MKTTSDGAGARNTFGTDVGITAPRYMRGSRHAYSCSGGISFLGFAPTRRSHNASIYY